MVPCRVHSGSAIEGEEKRLDGVGREQFMNASIELKGQVWEHDTTVTSFLEGCELDNDTVFSVVVPVGAGVKAAAKR
jgi:hypothetical protein